MFNDFFMHLEEMAGCGRESVQQKAHCKTMFLILLRGMPGMCLAATTSITLRIQLEAAGAPLKYHIWHASRSQKPANIQTA